MISAHSFFYTPLRINRWIFPRKGKHRRILPNLNISRGEKLHQVWIIVEGSPSRKLDFPNIYVTFSIDFPNIYIMLICSPMLMIHFSCYFGKRRRFLPPGVFTFLTSSAHAPLNTVLTKYKIM